MALQKKKKNTERKWGVEHSSLNENVFIFTTFQNKILQKKERRRRKEKKTIPWNSRTWDMHREFGLAVYIDAIRSPMRRISSRHLNIYSKNSYVYSFYLKRTPNRWDAMNKVRYDAKKNWQSQAFHQLFLSRAHRVQLKHSFQCFQRTFAYGLSLLSWFRLIYVFGATRSSFTCTQNTQDQTTYKSLLQAQMNTRAQPNLCG